MTELWGELFHGIGEKLKRTFSKYLCDNCVKKCVLNYTYRYIKGQNKDNNVACCVNLDSNR